MEEELRISNSRFDRIDLPLIARTGNEAEILKLFEMIIFVLLNSPYKATFVHRIMELTENDQVQLMHFINKVMEGGDDQSADDAYKKELESVKNERKRFSDRALELEQELSLAHEEYAVLHASYQELQVENERLRFELDKRSEFEEKETNAVEQDLRSRMGEKDEMIRELKKNIEKHKKRFEAEIVQMRDELEAANLKANEVGVLEKNLAQFKKKLEDMGNVKQQLEEVSKHNESLTKTIEKKHLEIEELMKAKHMMISLKEKLEQERLKGESLVLTMEAKEKQLKKMEKQCNEYRGKAELLQRQNDELMANDFYAESSHASEDSFGKLEKEDKLINIKDKPRGLNNEQLEGLSRELNLIKGRLAVKKNKIKRIKETYLMILEDHRSRFSEIDSVYEYYEKCITDLQQNNIYLSEEIQKVNESLSERENEAFNRKQLIENIEELKSAKLALSNEHKVLLQEKEENIKLQAESFSQLLESKAIVAKMEIEISELQMQTKVLNEQIKAAKDREEVYKEEIQSLKSDSICTDELSKIRSMQAQVINLKAEAAALNLQLAERTEQMNKLVKQNELILEENKSQILKAKEEYSKEIEKKDLDLVRQAEEATNELMKEKERLVNQLQSERRHTILTFQRAMSTKEAPSLVGKEVFRLRETLMQKEKEIARLNRNNKELKNCWKQSAKLLKAVWKELGKESEKIEIAVKERVSLS